MIICNGYKSFKPFFIYYLIKYLYDRAYNPPPEREHQRTRISSGKNNSERVAATKDPVFSCDPYSHYTLPTLDHGSRIYHSNSNLSSRVKVMEPVARERTA